MTFIKHKQRQWFQINKMITILKGMQQYGCRQDDYVMCFKNCFERDAHGISFKPGDTEIPWRAQSLF